MDGIPGFQCRHLQIRANEHGTRQEPVFGVGISFIIFISIVIALWMYGGGSRTRSRNKRQ